jgi:hypothetical protein
MQKQVYSIILNTALYLQYPRLTYRFFRAAKALPNIAFPNHYYEWIQWRKIFDHNPLWVIYSDKLAAKSYIASRLPQLSTAKVLWIGTDIEDAPRELLQGDVVVKTNHGCNHNYFIRNGVYDWDRLRQRTRRWTKKPFGKKDHEWSSLQVKHKLFIEEMVGTQTNNLIEINIRAGNGRLAYGTLLIHPKTPRQSVVYVNQKRQRNLITCGESVAYEEIEAIAIPEGYDEAVRLALAMSQDADYARYDFFWADGTLYGAEITVYPASGYGDPRGDENLALIGAAWDIGASWFMRQPQTTYRKLLAKHFQTWRPQPGPK